MKSAPVKTETTMNLVKIEEGVYELTRTEIAPIYETDFYRKAADLDEEQLK